MNTEVISYAPPDGARLERQARLLVEQVNTFEITDQVTFEMAVSEAKALKLRMKALQETQDGITAPIRVGLEKVYALFRGPRQLMESCEKIWKGKIDAWQVQVEQAQAAEQRAADARAEAERQRIEREAAELRERAAAATTDDEKQQAEAEAQSLEATAAVVSAAPIAAAGRKVEGLSTAKQLEYTLTDKLALFKFCAFNIDAMPELLDLWNLDSIKMKSHVKAKGKHLGFPGVEVKTGRTVRLG